MSAAGFTQNVQMTSAFQSAVAVTGLLPELSDDPCRRVRSYLTDVRLSLTTVSPGGGESADAGSGNATDLMPREHASGNDPPAIRLLMTEASAARGLMTIST